MLAFRDRVRGGQLNVSELGSVTVLPALTRTQPSNWGPHQSKILLVLAIDLLLVLYFTSRSGSVLSWLGAGSESDESAQTSWSSRVLGTFQYHLKAPTTTRDLQRALIEDYKAGRWNYTPSDLDPRERMELEYVSRRPPSRLGTASWQWHRVRAERSNSRFTGTSWTERATSTAPLERLSITDGFQEECARCRSGTRRCCSSSC